MAGCRRAGDLRRHLVLQRERIVHGAVGAARPQMRAGLGLDQLRRDADAIAGPAHAALDDVADAEVAGERADIGDAAPCTAWRHCGP